MLDPAVMFILVVVGFIFGWIAAKLAVWLTATVDEKTAVQKGATTTALWLKSVPICTAILFLVHGWLLLDSGCQSVTEVRPSQPLIWNRLPFQLLFIWLMLVATLTDFLDYSIPDFVVFPGALVAMIWATASGELQMIHAWVDWNVPFVERDGQYIPQWIKDHQHWHGFVWSISGALTGSLIMLAGRLIAHGILRVPSIGLGDVTLMAMIGAFMGWQPVLYVLAIAPLVGLVLGLGGRVVTGRNFVAFGPYLCIAAVIVLWTWQSLWEGLQLRVIFSHWPTIAGLLLGTFAAFCVLLVAMRWFMSVDAKRLR